MVVSVLAVTACGTTDPGAAPLVTTTPTQANVPSAQAVETSTESPSTPAQPPTGPGLTTDGTWVLVEGTVDGSPLAVDGNGTVTMNVAPDVLVGQAACNDYEAAYVIDEGGLVIEVMGMTEMACGDSVALQDAYVAALGRVDAFDRVADGELRLVGEGVELVFATEAPVATSELVGSTWTLVALQDGEATIEPEGDGFVRFDETTMTGSTGCRALDGTWSQQGSEIAFSNLGASGQCPAALQEQDGFVTGIFEDMTATVSGDQLVLASRDGDRALVYDRP